MTLKFYLFGTFSSHLQRHNQQHQIKTHHQMFCFRLPHAASGLSWSQAAVLSGHSTPPPRLLDLDSHQLGQVWANITGHEHNLNNSINVHSENSKHNINN